MDPSEAQAWARAAPARMIRDVRNEAAFAYGDWVNRIYRPAELADLGPWCPAGVIPPRQAANAAAAAAAEVAIITAIWPGKPADVLRASWE